MCSFAPKLHGQPYKTECNIEFSQTEKDVSTLNGLLARPAMSKAPRSWEEDLIERRSHDS